jgi:molecular chaperone IbpA|tara:strand:- start:605 stop:1045 length:441 start_codon:yes stop_codon:yes gene_type:complete
MTTIEAFGQFRPFTVGFDTIFDKLSDAAIPHSGKINIPYNIVKSKNESGDDIWFIEMAVAGYNKKHIDIELKENNLTITCSKKDEAPPEDAVEFVHKGIAERNFYKTFALAEHVKVNGAEIVDGILVIELFRKIPEKEKPKTIKIK